MLGWTVLFICTIFHVLYSRVCGDHYIGTIFNMLYIFYRRLSIVLKVCTSYLYFHHIILSFLSPTSSILVWLCGVSLASLSRVSG